MRGLQQDLFGSSDGIVRDINPEIAYPFLLNRHYAKRIPSISFAYGMYTDKGLVGVVTYGKPPAAPARSGLCGEEFADRVYELNRLCLLDNEKNQASQIVGASLKLMGGPKIIVSYADPSHGHVGTIYQATNFIYTGLTAKRTDWAVRGSEHIHGLTIADEFRGHPNRAEAMRAKYGNDFYLKERPRKHRYVIFLGSKGARREMREHLKYPIEPYPKRLEARA